MLIKTDKILFFGLFLLVLKVSFDASAIIPYNDQIDSVLSLLAAAALTVNILFQKFTSKKIIIYAFISFFGIYTAFITRQLGFLITIITVMAISNFKFDSVIRYIYKYELVFCFFHTVLFGILVLFGRYPLFNVYGEIVRFDFGFSHPNTCSIYVFNLVLMWVWINYKKIKSSNFFCLILVGILLFIFTRTRTAVIEFFVLIIFLLIAKSKKRNRLLSVIAQGIVPVISICVVCLIILYPRNNQFVLSLDKLLSSRIRLGSYGFYHYGLSFFGKNINFEIEWDSYWGLNSFTFDCTYTSLMMMQGTIWLMIISIAFFCLGQRKDNRINIMIIIWSLYALTEVHGLNGFKCFPILLVSFLLSNLSKNTCNGTLRRCHKLNSAKEIECLLK